MTGLIFLVPKQAPIGYFRNLEQGYFAYLNGGDPLRTYFQPFLGGLQDCVVTFQKIMRKF